MFIDFIDSVFLVVHHQPVGDMLCQKRLQWKSVIPRIGGGATGIKLIKLSKHSCSFNSLLFRSAVTYETHCKTRWKYISYKHQVCPSVRPSVFSFCIHKFTFEDLKQTEPLKDKMKMGLLVRSISLLMFSSFFRRMVIVKIFCHFVS